ncbi:MAG: hypothetical protein J6B82_05690 [Bacteroidaceae bacterium]|nr:hypothetical protein [Bacteroidaceae bacterium]
MSVRYSIEKQKIGFGNDKKEAYVGRVQLGETVDTDMLVEQISLRTGMNEAQAKMLLENITDSIMHFCKLGSGVRLGKLGILKPTIKSKSADDADSVEIVKLRYRFLPSVQMKEALDELDIRKLGDDTDEGVVDEGDDGAEGDDGSFE